MEDEDGNLIPTDNTGSLVDYSDDVLSELYIDSDGDGIPDVDDSMDNTDSATDFMGALDAINGMVDEISAEIDTLIE
jgi:hypothetical protein